MTGLGPKKKHVIHRTSGLVRALTGKGKRHLFGYQQQDAQEFFQHISSLVTGEEVLASVSSLFDLSGIIPVSKDNPHTIYAGKPVTYRPILDDRNPFTGLLANKMVCLTCGYQYSLRLDTFDNLSIPVSTCSNLSLIAMIRNYSSSEIVEYNCDKCSLAATISNLKEQEHNLKLDAPERPKHSPKSMKKKTPNSSPHSQSRKRMAFPGEVQSESSRISIIRSNLNILESHLKEGKYDEKLVSVLQCNLATGC
jgi:hypothetical protein